MKKILGVAFLLLMVSCDKNEADDLDNVDSIDGTGAFLFEVNQTNLSTSMNVFFHIPNTDVVNMPVLFVFHGAGRDAREMRNAWISESNTKEFIVIAPEFTEQSFPGGNGYILGNVFVDSNNPSPQTLNPESDWTFSIIEPLFDRVKSLSGNASSQYDVYGFSAGAQFAHRLMMFKPNARFNKVVSSAAGWYTVPDSSVSFPYGIANSPLENLSLASFFSKSLRIQIGTLDNNPNAPSLRRNTTVDQQGDNRYDRAYYLYNTSQNLAESLGLDINWDIIETPNNDHTMEQSIPQASDLLY